MKICLPIVLLSITLLINPAFGNNRIYTMKGVKKSGNIYLDNITNAPISGFLNNYFDSGELNGVIPVNNGLRHGVAKYFSKSGKLRSETRYEYGKKHGLQKTFFNNGNVHDEMTFDNSRLISYYQYSLDGEKDKIPNDLIYKYNLRNPNSLEYKEDTAYEEIENAAKSLGITKSIGYMNDDEKMKVKIDSFSKAFELAGYNYFETIISVVNDLKNNREKILLHGNSRHKLILMSFAMMKSECKNKKIDCLNLFPTDTRQSAKWLLENANFSW